MEHAPDVNAVQHGGSHYKENSYQHWDFVADAKLDYFRGNATKYLSRWRKKNGVEDLHKAAHYVQKAQTFMPSSFDVTSEDLVCLERFIFAADLPLRDAEAFRAVVFKNWQAALAHIKALIDEATANGAAPR